MAVHGGHKQKRRKLNGEEAYPSTTRSMIIPSHFSAFIFPVPPLQIDPSSHPPQLVISLSQSDFSPSLSAFLSSLFNLFSISSSNGSTSRHKNGGKKDFVFGSSFDPATRAAARSLVFQTLNQIFFFSPSMPFLDK